MFEENLRREIKHEKEKPASSNSSGLKTGFVAFSEANFQEADWFFKGFKIYIRELTQQDGCKPQDGRMTKKFDARLCIPDIDIVRKPRSTRISGLA